jgi:ABC-type glycerol-3-phosphate transport system substrate-binding protein
MGDGLEKSMNGMRWGFLFLGCCLAVVSCGPDAGAPAAGAPAAVNHPAFTLGYPAGFDISRLRAPSLLKAQKRLGFRMKTVRLDDRDLSLEVRAMAASEALPDALILPPDLASPLSELFPSFGRGLHAEGKEVLSFLEEEYPFLLGWMTRGNGDIWAVPLRIGMEPGSVWYIRKDRLANLDTPPPLTSQELAAALLSLQEGQPEHGGTASFVWVNYGGVENLVEAASFFGVYSHHYLDGGTVVWGPSTEGFRDTLAWLRDLYSQDLIDPMFAVLSEASWRDRIADGRAGFTYAHILFLEKEGRSSRWQALPPPRGSDGSRVFTSSGANLEQVVVIGRRGRQADSVVAWLNFLYTERGRWLNLFGVDDRDYKVIRGRPVFTRPAERGTPDLFTEAANSLLIATRQEARWLFTALVSPLTSRIFTAQHPALEDPHLPPLRFSREELRLMSRWKAMLVPVWQSYWLLQQAYERQLR